MQDKPDMVSVKDAAHELGIHVKSLHRIIAQKGIQKYKRLASKEIYISREDLDTLNEYRPI